MKFKIIGSSLIRIDDGSSIIEGENGYTPIEIESERYRNKLDLMTLSFRLTAVSVSDSSRSACQVLAKSAVGDDKLCLYGEVGSDLSALTGKVVLMLTGADSDNILAKFDSRPLIITDDISMASMPSASAAEQLLSQVQLEVQKAIDARNEAEEIAGSITSELAVSVASEDTAGTVRSGGDISVSEDGAVTVNSVGGKTLGVSVPADAKFTDTTYAGDGVTVMITDGVISAAPDSTLSADSENSVQNKAVFAELERIKEYLGCSDADIIGLRADFENSVFTRLGGAAGKSAGSDFDGFAMYGGRRRCNVLDDGTITAFYGDSSYAEDGSNGQVMVYQPKFYYKVQPLKIDPITGGSGYHLRKANYFISAKPKEGFRLHPAFYDENGNPVEYVLVSAYEGSVYDVSEEAYLANDEQIASFTADTGDKLASVAGVKPCSGKSQSLTRANAEILSNNHGRGWHIETVRTVSMDQLLMAVEYGTFNMQDAIGKGVVNIANIPGENCAAVTGATSSLGSGTGCAEGDGTTGTRSVSYRGMENPWGGIWSLVNGMNGFTGADGKLHMYICTDCDFAENKNSGNYKPVGFSLPDREGYISAFGYSPEYDWLFIASETSGSSTAPVGDYYTHNPSGAQWRSAFIGGYWGGNTMAGGFNFYFADNFGVRARSVGCRLTYIPAAV